LLSILNFREPRKVHERPNKKIWGTADLSQAASEMTLVNSDEPRRDQDCRA
jgi:hypothetical protein